MKERTKKLIIELHQATGSVRSLEIEKEFPKLFREDDLVVGKWYKQGFVFRFNGVYGNYTQYGFTSDGRWIENIGIHRDETYIPATDKEVQQALTKEAKKKRGLKPLNHRCLQDDLVWANNVGGEYRYYPKENKLMIGASTVFLDGKWAEIVETITKEQAEEARKVLAQYNEQ
tara:strand:- start:3103 stop:3621 length:519 start_codon:yes stop_codon:yes gene_type:complete